MILEDQKNIATQWWSIGRHLTNNEYTCILHEYSFVTEYMTNNSVIAALTQSSKTLYINFVKFYSNPIKIVHEVPTTKL